MLQEVEAGVPHNRGDGQGRADSLGWVVNVAETEDMNNLITITMLKGGMGKNSKLVV